MHSELLALLPEAPYLCITPTTKGHVVTIVEAYSNNGPLLVESVMGGGDRHACCLLWPPDPVPPLFVACSMHFFTVQVGGRVVCPNSGIFRTKSKTTCC